MYSGPANQRYGNTTYATINLSNWEMFLYLPWHLVVVMLQAGFFRTGRGTTPLWHHLSNMKNTLVIEQIWILVLPNDIHQQYLNAKQKLTVKKKQKQKQPS